MNQRDMWLHVALIILAVLAAVALLASTVVWIERATRSSARPRWPQIIASSSSLALALTLWKLIADQSFQLILGNKLAIAIPLVPIWSQWLVDQIAGLIERSRERLRATVERTQTLEALRPFTNLALLNFETSCSGMSGAFDSTLEGRDRTLILGVFASKFEELCSQVCSATYYMRFDRFRDDVWPMLTHGSDYRSVCDLSPYSRLAYELGKEERGKYLEDLSKDWHIRLDKELRTLSRHRDLFQKVIVYSPPKIPDADKSYPRPPCILQGQCKHESCGMTSCIVKQVTKRWANWATNWATIPNSTVFLADKQVLQDELGPLVRGGHDALLRSIDLGLFGDAFIGEEFKVPVELDHERHDMETFLYRFRYKKDIVTEVRGFFDIVVENAQVVG